MHRKMKKALKSWFGMMLVFAFVFTNSSALSINAMEAEQQDMSETIRDIGELVLPTGGIGPFISIPEPEEELPDMKTLAEARLRSPMIRAAAPYSSVPGGMRYGYDWISNSANTGSDSAVLTALYEALVRYAEAAYQSAASYDYNSQYNYYYAGQLDTTQINLPINLNGDQLDNNGTDSKKSNWLMELAWAAFCRDNPQYYMFANGYVYSYNTSLRITSIIPIVSADYATYAGRQRINQIVEAKYAEYAKFAATVSTDYDKARTVHDKMLAERDYSFVNGQADDGAYAHNILGVLDLSTRGPVCEAYAEAYAYILNRLGIDTITVFGNAGSGGGNGSGGHAWNLVKLNGKWYYVDSTWNDFETVGNQANSYNDEGNLKNILYYRYFMVGSGNAAFTGQHTPGTPEGVSVDNSLCYMFRMPSNIDTADYNTMSGSSYMWLTDNGQNNKIYSYGPNYNYYIGYTDRLMSSTTGDNALFIEELPGSGSYLWNGGMSHNLGSYTVASAATDVPVIGDLWKWGFNSAEQGINLQFNNPVKLIQNTDYEIIVEKPYHTGANRAYVYGKGSYRGIDFGVINLTFVNASATASSVTVVGNAGKALSGTPSTIITLTNASVVRGGLSNVDATGWFTGIPAGMTATANGTGLSNQITITFGGTPATGSSQAFNIAVPPSAQTSGATLNVTSNPDAKLAIEAQKHIITFSVTGGIGNLTAAVDSSQVSDGTAVLEGKNVVFAATPNNGYRVKEWKDNNAAVNGTAATYTLSGISAAHTVTVVFEPIPPTVTSVTVNSSAVTVQKGTSYQFSATVAGTNYPLQTVTWEVTSWSSVATTITQDGILNVGADEASDSLKVRAKSVFDPSVESDTTIVTVTDTAVTPPTVSSVAITPNAITLGKGDSYTFSAVVNGTNNPSQGVAWSIYGSSLSSVTASGGAVTVSANETASEFKVRATSNVNTGVYGEATVTVYLPAQSYMATISPESENFTTVTVGYGVQTEQLFTVTNTGTGQLTNLSASLGSTDFEISTALSAASINPGGTATIGVRPKTGLTANTYTDTLTISGSGISLTADISFTVSATPVYTLTVNNGSGSGNYAGGAVVTVTANAAPSGQRFKEWNVTPSVSFTDGTDKTSLTAKFTMPSQAVTATATYEPIPVTTHTVSVNGSYATQTGAGSYAAGATVTVNAGSLANYSFGGWTSTDGVTFSDAGSATTTFIMPAKNVNIYASWNYNGSSGSGGDNGGSVSYIPTPAPVSTPVPTSAPTSAPKANIIVDGKEYAIGEMEIKGNNVVITVNQSEIENQIKNASGSVIIPVTSTKSDTVTAQLIAKNIDDIANRNMTLTVRVNNISYDIPAAAVDTKALMGLLGASGTTDISIAISITTNVDIKIKAQVDNAVKKFGGEVVAPAIQFTITAGYNGKTVEVSTFGGFVGRTVEISPDQAKKVTTAIVVEPNGSTRHVPTKLYQRNGKWYVEINSLTNSTYVLVNNVQTFADTAGKWYQTAASEMANRKIMAGTGNNMFEGDREVTRAEFAAIVVNALGLPTLDKTIVFNDVPGSAWYFGAVNAAYRYGIVTGRGDGLYDPNSNITWQEAMAMIRNAAKVAGYKGASGSFMRYPDASSVSDWAKDSVAFYVGSGLFIRDGMLRPTENITRAETAVAVLELLRVAKLVDF